MTKRLKIALGVIAALLALAAAVAWARTRSARVEVLDPKVTRDGVDLGGDYQTPRLTPAEKAAQDAADAIDRFDAAHPEVGDFLRDY